MLCLCLDFYVKQRIPFRLDFYVRQQAPLLGYKPKAKVSFKVFIYYIFQL